MATNKTAEILQQQIDRLNQEQTENKWNEKDKKLFEKMLGLVHDDPFRIFYADGGEVHRILELVYPETVKEKIGELFRIKYVYDGFLKYGEVVKPQIEIERPNLEILIKDISDHYLEIYHKPKKHKENTIKKCRSILEKYNKHRYVTIDDSVLISELAQLNECPLEEQVDVLLETLENNNVAIQEMLKMKVAKKGQKESTIEIEKETSYVDNKVPEVMLKASDLDIQTESPFPMIEPDFEETDSFEEVIQYQEENKPSLEETQEEMFMELPEELEEAREEIDDELLEETKVDSVVNTDQSNYIKQYLKALEEIDPTDLPTIHYVLPKYHMPNFNEIMEQLIATIKEQIRIIKEEEQDCDVKRVRALREELGRAQQLLKTITSYMEKQDKNESSSKEKIVDGEEIQLLLLENENGDSLIENDFKHQLTKEQYGIAMELLRCLEHFSDPNIRKKARKTPILDIHELSSKGVHLFFEPFAENTYIVIALIAEKNGYHLWIEDKLRLRHGLFQKQEKGMQRRWNQHGTRNTMLLGSETAYLEMQDMAEKR